MVTAFLFLGSKIFVDGDCSHEIRRLLLLGQESYDKPRQCAENQIHYSADKDPYSQVYGLPRGHVRFESWERKEGGAPKNRCLQSVVLEKTPASLLDSKEIKPVNLKQNQPWILIGKEWCWAETPLFWSSADSLEKSLMVGKTEGRQRRGHQKTGWPDGITDAMDMNLGKLQETVRDTEAWQAAAHGVAKSQTWLGSWTSTTNPYYWTMIKSRNHLQQKTKQNCRKKQTQGGEVTEEIKE